MKAIIFDMDGVLINSEAVWHQLEGDFYRQLIPSIKESFFEEIIGISVEQMFNKLVDEYGFSMSFNDFLSKNRKLAKLIYSQKVQLYDGVIELLKSLKPHYPLALASSSSIFCIDLVIERFKLGPFFQHIISSDHVNGRGKPAPDIFLFTAEKLNIKASDCLVIEDSINGIKAAIAAKMCPIAYSNGHNQNQNLEPAHATVTDFTTLTPMILNSYYDSWIAGIKGRVKSDFS